MSETHNWTLLYKLQTFFTSTYLPAEDSDTQEHIANQGPKKDYLITTSLSEDEAHVLLYLSDT